MMRNVIVFSSNNEMRDLVIINGFIKEGMHVYYLHVSHHPGKYGIMKFFETSADSLTMIEVGSEFDNFDMSVLPKELEAIQEKFEYCVSTITNGNGIYHARFLTAYAHRIKNVWVYDEKRFLLRDGEDYAILIYNIQISWRYLDIIFPEIKKVDAEVYFFSGDPDTVIPEEKIHALCGGDYVSFK